MPSNSILIDAQTISNGALTQKFLGALKKLSKRIKINRAKDLRKSIKAKNVKTLRTKDGKAIRHSKYRGRVDPSALEKGHVVPIKKNGYPDFSKHEYKGKMKEKPVKIEMTGDRNKDFKAANDKAGFDKTPDGYTWHHSENVKIENGKVKGEMQLVKTEVHDSVPHSGGCQKYKAITGDQDAY